MLCLEEALVLGCLEGRYKVEQEEAAAAATTKHLRLLLLGIMVLHHQTTMDRLHTIHHLPI
jgi:hypothetical protein